MISVHWVVNSVQGTVYSVQCTRYSARVYSVGSYMQGRVWHTWEINKQSLTQGGIICTVYSIQCTVYIVQCTPSTPHFTLYTVLCYTVHCSMCTEGKSNQNIISGIQ